MADFAVAEVEVLTILKEELFSALLALEVLVVLVAQEAWEVLVALDRWTFISPFWAFRPACASF
jgi:hypothetical protein